VVYYYVDHILQLGKKCVCVCVCVYVYVCMSLYVSFICSFFVLRLCMWNHSSVFSRGPFFRCEVCPVFFLLCHVCVVHIWSLVYGLYC
jgi:hypothetical protein